MVMEMAMWITCVLPLSFALASTPVTTLSTIYY